MEENNFTNEKGEAKILVSDIGAVIEDIGFGRFQVPLLILSGLGFFATTTHLIMVSFLRAPLQDSFPNMTNSKFAMLMSATFAGELLGGLAWGWISDKAGRRFAYLGTALMASIFAILCSHSACIYSFATWRFFLGVAIGGCLNIDFVYFMEFIPAKSRGFRTTFIILIGIFAFFYVALMAKLLLPDWSRFVLACGILYPVLLIGRLFWRWESPRLLLSMGKNELAVKVLQDMARINGAPSSVIPKHLEEMKQPAGKAHKSILFSQIFGRLTITSLLFFAQTFGYYGLTLWLGNLAKSRSIRAYSPISNFVAIGVAELPGLGLTTLLIDRIGRKWVTFMNFAGSSLATTLLLLVKEESTFIAISSLCYFFIVGSWASLYIATPELFPTNCRSRAFAVAGAIGKLAGVISPAIFARLYDANLPVSVMITIISGSFGFAAILTVFLLAETRNTVLL